MKHFDVVQNDWTNGVQRRVDAFVGDVPLTTLAGSHRFLTEPHSHADCPFRKGDEVPMERFDSLEEAFASQDAPERAHGSQ